MQLHSNTFGHVALAIPATAAMESAEEAHETTMMRCRYGQTCFKTARVSFVGLMPRSDKIIRNPSTLRYIAEIYETSLQQAFDSWGNIPAITTPLVNA